MGRFVENLCELITDTPLLKLARFGREFDCELIGKLEVFNPGWSVKDRIGKAMIEAAEKNGTLKPGGTIIEPTSGNTGIGLALVSAVKGYKCIVTMPGSMSIERKKILQSLGAELILTEANQGMPGAIEQANELVEQMDNAFMPQQFCNPANPQVHYDTTGPETWNGTEGKVDIFVSGVGTGGTISGTGKFLKEKNSDIKIIAVEPEESPVLSGGIMGPHMIQGIGAGFIPEIYNKDVVDDIVTVNSFEAIDTAREIIKTEGLLCGISSGAAVCAAKKIASKSENIGKRIVVILPDTGERYISTLLFYED